MEQTLHLSAYFTMTLSALLFLCEGNPLLTGGFLSKRVVNLVIEICHMYFVLKLDKLKLLNKLSKGRRSQSDAMALISSKLSNTGFGKGNLPVICRFPSKRGSNAGNISMTWCYCIVVTEPLPTIQIDPSTFADDWLAALKDQRDTDVLFVLRSGTEIRGHKIVLCAASSFFADVICQTKVEWCQFW